MADCFVYGLRAPGTAPIRYVGKSSNPWKRLASHCSASAAAPVRAWVTDIGTEPEVVVLQRCATSDEAYAAEHEWIARLAGGGALLNASMKRDVPRGKRRRRFSGLGQRVLERRKSLALAQCELAASVDVDPAVLSRIETAESRLVTAELAVLLARALGCSVEWLVTGEQPQPQAAE